MNFIVVASSEHIRTVFKNTRLLSNKSVTLIVLDHLLGAPRNILSFYKADNSGLATKAHARSKGKPEDRVFYFQIHTAHKYLIGQHLHALNERFMATLDRDLDAMDVGHEWVEYADLYKFLQLTISHSFIETVYGEKLLGLNPTFVEDFWEFEANTPNFPHAIPRWLIPSTYRVREKLIRAFMKSHAHANVHFDCSRIGPDEPE